MSDATPGPRSRLAAAREARGLTPAQAAEQMRLTPEAVQAMEEGRYDTLGPAVFVRGHLRKYAGLLGVSPEDLLADYESAAGHVAESNLIPPASAHTPVRRTRGRSRRPRWQAWLAAAILLGVAAGGAWWLWHARHRPTAAASPPAVQPAPAPATGEAAPAVEPGAPANGGAATPGGPAQPAPAATTGSLKLEFSRPCWLEVYDARGERLAFELEEPGAELSLGGSPPWRVVLGDVAAARLSVDHKPVVVPDRLIAGKAANLSVNEDGSVGPAVMVASRN